MFARRRSAPPLVRHLEARLGTIEMGWSEDPDGATMPFKIVRFARGSHDDDRAFGTLGLSHHRLEVERSHGHVRVELVFLLRTHLPAHVAVAELDRVGRHLVASHLAVVPGDVAPVIGADLRSHGVTGLLVSHPAYFDEDFDVFSASDGDVEILCLHPVFPDEVHLLQAIGWDAFADRPVAQDVDRTDLDRDHVH